MTVTDAEPPYSGAFTVRRAAAVLLAVGACWLLAPAPAAALNGPPSGTVDLGSPGSPDETFRTHESRPQAAGAYVGDVNGGLQDIAIGVPTADPGGRTDAGSVYVLFGGGPKGSGGFGTIDLANIATRGYRIDGAAAGDRLGTSIVRLGYDVGGDGLSDFAVGAPRATGGGPARGGVVYLVAGVAGQRADVDVGSDDDTSIIKVTAAAAGDRAGEALSAPLGTRRLIIGAPRADPGGLANAGSAFVLTDLPAAVPATRAISLAKATGYRLDGRVAGGRAGSAVGWSLDFDGNTRSEVLVGAPRVPDASGTLAGEAYIVPSATSGAITLGNPKDGGFVVAGEPGMGLGSSIAGLADMSADALGDVAIGAPTASPEGRGRAGSAVVVLSRRTPALPIPATAAPGSVLRIDGAATFDRLGTAVAPANLDGAGSASDLLVSAPGAAALTRSSAGAVFALTGTKIAGGIDLTRLGDSGVRFAGPRPDERGGTNIATGGSDFELAIFGGRTLTSVARLRVPAPAPAGAPVEPSQVPGCAITRDIELVVDGSRSMAADAPFVRTAIDAMLSKPRSAAINVGAIEVGSRTRQVFPPLTLPPNGYADGRDLQTLRRLLDENVQARGGNPDYAAGLAAAVAARPQASALVLITDASAPPPAAPLPSPGRRVYVLQVGNGSNAPSAGILKALALATRGGYFAPLDGATLPTALALVEAGLTCEQDLKSRVGRAASKQIVEATLGPQRQAATFQTDLLEETRTATLTFSFTPRSNTRRARRAACVRASPVGLRGLRVVAGGREVARASEPQVRRALSGGRIAFDGLRATGRCGRGFLVIEVSGLERIAGAQAQAAASSPGRRLGVTARLRKPPVKRAVVRNVGVGSATSKGRG